MKLTHISSWMERHAIRVKDTEQTKVDKTTYLELIELAIRAYEPAELRQIAADSRNGTIEDIQSFSRVTSVMGILLAHGRMKEHYDLWEQMMEACCRDLHQHTDNLMVDFSVKEIMLAYWAMKDHINSSKAEEWLAWLEKIQPYQNYVFTHKPGEKKGTLHNINIYNMVGEYLRELAGLTHTDDYFDAHWPYQLEQFDENGMYMDPGCPILYDLTTRCQIQIMLVYGYRGKYYKQLDEQLRKSGIQTLFMQSAAFELPFGGRSNQYLFNEALIAANAEFEANRYKALGDLKTAGMFKRSARLAVTAIKRWLLEPGTPRHIKNFFPPESGFGTENYGYYNKYMATFGAFLYLAVLSADDTIEEYHCPAELGGYVWQSSDAFHKVFASCGAYSLEIDTRADVRYDAAGLGRLHKRGVPTELALSMPCASAPNYRLPSELDRLALSLCAGWRDEDGRLRLLNDVGCEPACSVDVLEEQPDIVKLQLTYTGATLPEGAALQETYTLTAAGLLIEVKLMGASLLTPCYTVPLLQTNGKDTTRLELTETTAIVSLNEYRYEVRTDARLQSLGIRCGNRNGIYEAGLMDAGEGKHSLRVFLQLMVDE